MQDIKGKVAYITGGSKGIGYGIAKVLLQHGMKVAITGRKQADITVAAQTLDPGGQNVLPLVSDVGSLEAEQNAVSTAWQHFGSIDLVVANAGVGHFASIENLTPAQWNETINTNLTGVFHTVKASLEALKQSKGYLITMASLAGTNFFENGSAYNASKFGLVGFTQAVMLDLRKYGIRVTTIMPGSVTSHFNNHVPNEADAWKIQPEDIGQMIVDLLQLHPRTLPSKIEVRPTQPPGK